MIKVPYWIVRRRTDGWVVPQNIDRRRGSHVEPVSPTVPGFTPRLFSRRNHAAGYLTTWLKGAVTAEYSRNDEIDLYTTPVATRVRAEMEVVEVFLEVPS